MKRYRNPISKLIYILAYYVSYFWSWLLIKLGLRQRYTYYRKSIRQLRQMYYKPTKAYADHRQKAVWNRPKKLSKAMRNLYHG